MVKIAGMRIIWHIMKIYSQYNFKEFVITIGYKGQAIKDYFVNFNDIVNQNKQRGVLDSEFQKHEEEIRKNAKNAPILRVKLQIIL